MIASAVCKLATINIVYGFLAGLWLGVLLMSSVHTVCTAMWLHHYPSVLLFFPCGSCYSLLHSASGLLLEQLFITVGALIGHIEKDELGCHEPDGEFCLWA